MDDDLYDFGGGDSAPSYSSSNTNTYPTSNSYSNASTKYPDTKPTYQTDSSNNYDNNARTSTTNTRRQNHNASSPGSSSTNDQTDRLDDLNESKNDNDNITPPQLSHPLGFCNVEVPPLTIASDWKRGQRAVSVECQTKELRTTEADTQTSTVRDQSIQTSDHGSGPSIDPKGSVYSGFQAWSPKDQDLELFIRWAGLEMEKQLTKNETSHAFDDYEPGTSNDDVALTCLHVLIPTEMQNVKTVTQVLEEERRENDRNDRKERDGNSKRNSSNSSSSNSKKTSYGEEPGLDLQTTSMSWNATGSVLAVAYGRLDESGWCNITHAGCCLYHVFQRDFQPNKPQTILETSSYLMSVCCHPEIPSLIAGGTFNGEVIVWDTSLTGEDRCIGTSEIDDYYHREPVVDVSWVYDVSTRKWNIASISGEGKVLFWNINNKCIHPIHGHLLAVKAKGKSTRVTAGGTCMSFQTNGKHSSSFIVGSEGGHLFRCSVREGRSKVAPPSDANDLGWTSEGWALLCRLRSNDRKNVRNIVEQYARDNRLNAIGPAEIYKSQPPQEKLFPSPIDFAYEAHGEFFFFLIFSKKI